MKRINALCLSSLAGLGSLAAGPSFAQPVAPYYYGGLSVGQSRASIDEERITAGLLSEGLTTRAMERDERDIAFKLFGGYQFNRHFALEGGYFNLGKFGFTSSTVPAGTLTGQLKAQGVNLDVVGTLPINDRFAVFARAGAHYTQTRDTFRGTGAVGVKNHNPGKDAANFKVGVGMQYAFSPSVIVRGEAERYRIDDAVGSKGDIDVFSVSLVFPFGRPAAPARPAPVAYVAPPVVTAPAPAPVPAPFVVAPPVPVVAAAPERRRVSFSADSWFAFNQWTIRPEGKAALDSFSSELKGTRFEVITVEGHTDRLGSASYNQTLSAKRAEAVKEYLVSAGGTDASKITATGMGETTPVTKPGDCSDRQPRAKLIVCLQADRRVEVEVVGTR